MKRALIHAVALIGFASPALAQPCTGYSADARQSDGQVYDPAAVTAELVRLELRRAAGALPNGCTSARVAIQAQNGSIELRNGGTVLRGTFVRSNEIGPISSNAVELNGNARGALVRDGGVALNFLELEPGQFVPPGDYVAPVELVVGDAPARPFIVSVTVGPTLRFADGTRGEPLELGELSDGGEARASFFYRTNANVSVVAVSLNGGLQHEDGPSFGVIPYEATLSGRVLSLASPYSFTISNRGSGIQSEELVVRVAPQSGRFAGRYHDVIELNFTPF